MDNYEFCARVAADAVRGSGSKVLDYGCGAGEIVGRLRARGVDAYGCDAFYGGGSYRDAVPPDLIDRYVLAMADGRIPFPDGAFDVVINNQVLEHVADLDAVVDEMARVLKPQGTVLSLFPDDTVWREGHCGIPFLHWFPQGSRLRVAYATLLRRAGLGHHTAGKDAARWAADFCRWLDRWTYYRPAAAIDRAFRRRFALLVPIEEDWLAARLGPRAALVAWLPRRLRRAAVRRLAGRVFLARKAAAQLPEARRYGA